MEMLNKNQGAVGFLTIPAHLLSSMPEGYRSTTLNRNQLQEVVAKAQNLMGWASWFRGVAAARLLKARRNGLKTVIFVVRGKWLYIPSSSRAIKRMLRRAYRARERAMQYLASILTAHTAQALGFT